MKYYKTATATAHNNADTAATQDRTDNIVIDFSVIPDELKTAFITTYARKAYITTYDMVDFIDDNGTKYYIDFNIDRTAVYNQATGKRRYTIMTIRDYRITGYTAADRYYNRIPTYYQEQGNIRREYEPHSVDI